MYIVAQQMYYANLVEKRPQCTLFDPFSSSFPAKIGAMKCPSIYRGLQASASPKGLTLHVLCGVIHNIMVS